MRARLYLVYLPLLALGCAPTYSPLIRGAHYGAPGRLEEGRVEINGTAGGYNTPDFGNLTLGIGVEDWVAVEIGGNLSPADGRWALGYIGPRFSIVPHRERPGHFIADVEVGAGAGVGGSLNLPDAKGNLQYNPDGRSWSDRFAFGGYQGVGLGYRLYWFSIYARVRVEESQAKAIPATVWPSAMAGIELDIVHRAALSFGGGYMGYFNERDHYQSWFYQFGLTVFIDARPKHHAPAPAPPAPPPPT